jgi:hypothetical protein
MHFVDNVLIFQNNTILSYRFRIGCGWLCAQSISL